MTPCRLIYVYRRFEGSLCLHPQGQAVYEGIDQLTLNVKVLQSLETLVFFFYQSIWRVSSQKFSGFITPYFFKNTPSVIYLMGKDQFRCPYTQQVKHFEILHYEQK